MSLSVTKCALVLSLLLASVRASADVQVTADPDDPKFDRAPPLVPAPLVEEAAPPVVDVAPVAIEAPAPAPPAIEAPAPRAKGAPTTITGAIRAGVYADSDQTVVFRALASLAGAVGNWTISGTAVVDVVSSSSVDVRSSPALSKVDVVTTASGTSTSGGRMFDRRLAATLGTGWRSSSSGRGLNFAASYANENDYDSVSGSMNFSADVHHRMTTLLGGMTFTQNWIGSTIDKSFSRTMYELGWSAGFAQVLGQKDALRLRYDGAYANGYLASPYRNVRFGAWSTTTGTNQQLVFANSTGAASGLPELEPDTRLRHALVLEWVHSLTPKLALFAQARGAIDDWGVKSGSVALELRGSFEKWRVQVGYRFYAQTAADFYQTKYVLDPSQYSYYTSDKELGQVLGHTPHIDISRVIKQPRYAGDPRVLFDAHIVGLFYTYPGFALLGARQSVFLDLGFTWE